MVGVYSFSKTYSMTGWRVGYAMCPRPLAQLLGTIQEPMLSCISAVSQHAALAALLGPQDSLAARLATYRSRRDLVSGLPCDGGFTPCDRRARLTRWCCSPRVPTAGWRRSISSSMELRRRLGTAFGSRRVPITSACRWASSEANLREGIARLVDWAQSTAAGASIGAVTT